VKKEKGKVKKDYKIQASVLSYALFIMVIITIILGSLLMLSYYNHLNRNRYQIEGKLRRNVESGINLIMAGPSVLSYEEQRQISLYEEEFDNIHIRKDLWGLFDQLYCSAQYKNIFHEKKVLADVYYKTENTPALYLIDLNMPLCLCGNTFVQGECFVPEAGVKKGYVEGMHYERQELIYGNTSQSDSILPVNNEKFSRNTFDYAKKKYLDQADVQLVNYSSIEKDTLENSFYNEPIVIYEADSLLLNHSLWGNIVVICEKDIVISKECDLKDILIYGKNIYIEDGFKGRLQCFASESLITGDNCNFDYPSNLVLLSLKELNKTAYFRFGKGSKLKGTLVSNVLWTKKKYKTQLKVLDNTHITGQIYSNGTLELSGDVSGSVYCNEFILSRSWVLYINHLLDVEINIAKLPEDFVGVDMLNETGPSKIIKRLR